MDKKLEIAHIQVFVHAKTLQNMDIKLDYSKYMFLSAFLPGENMNKNMDIVLNLSGSSL